MTNSQNLPASIDDTNNLIDNSNKDNIEDNRELMFLRCLSIYPTVREAAIAAGYSEKTATSSIYTKIHSESFQHKLKEYYKINTTLRLPKIMQIENNVLNACLDDVNNVPKHSRTLKEMKQAAGILQHDAVPGVTMVKIDNIQILMQDMQSNKEVIDVSEDGK